MTTQPAARSVQSFSQASQDLFVRAMLADKPSGAYLEVGSREPVTWSNTYALETQLGWTGRSFEIDGNYVRQFNAARKNKCIQGDATAFDYREMLSSEGWPKQIDYLSLDIEPAEQTMRCLKRLPLDEFRFSVITFEHDAYAYGNQVRFESRSLLASLGYTLVVADVKIGGAEFEDWWIDPRVVPSERWSACLGKSIEHAAVRPLMDRAVATWRT